ncbi:RNA polymerase subunit sigma [Bacillus sonorensis]|uniref:RNA polymerase sigma factor n=1 Tax=Bacillus sonorensis TaxID=119858 RepID=UPI000BA616DF|nr:sigma-70 family RNA polymerase sigma factor [Bacillus sonorensis]PAD58668.1 RNA polymerase subunit sigma [Bacillus sonorensis]
MEPNRTQWQIRCAFNGFCKRVLKNETINIYNERRQRQSKEMTFSDLTPQEENQLYTIDNHYEGETQDFQVRGMRITPKLLAEAMHTLPDEKRIAVLLYYFFNMSDVEIGQLLDIPRSTVQYRRTSSFELLKRFLEGRADEWDD